MLGELGKRGSGVEVLTLEGRPGLAKQAPRDVGGAGAASRAPAYYRFDLLCPHRLVGGETALCGLEFGEAAAFLLNQVVLHTADTLRRFEDLTPRRGAFAEQHADPFFFSG